MAVGMGVHEAGHEQPAGRVAERGAGRGGHAGRPDRVNRVALDKDVGGLRRVAFDIEQPPAANDRVHGFRSPRCGLRAVQTMTVSSVSADQGKNIRSTITTSWNRTTPRTESRISAPNATGVRKNAVAETIR